MGYVGFLAELLLAECDDRDLTSPESGPRRSTDLCPQGCGKLRDPTVRCSALAAYKVTTGVGSHARLLSQPRSEVKGRATCCRKGRVDGPRV